MSIAEIIDFAQERRFVRLQHAVKFWVTYLRLAEVQCAAGTISGAALDKSRRDAVVALLTIKKQSSLEWAIKTFAAQPDALELKLLCLEVLLETETNDVLNEQKGVAA